MAQQGDWWAGDVAAADSAAAPAVAKADAGIANTQAGTVSTQVGTERTRALLPSDVKSSEADATIKTIKAEDAVAARDRKAQNQRLAGLRKQEDTSGILSSIQQARDNIGPLSTRLPGQILSNVWGTDAKDLHASLNSIMGPGVMEKLGEMKAQSATGASGFGALSEKELQLIKDSIGAIGQDQSPEQLLENLNKIEAHVRRFQAYNAGLDPEQPEVAQAVGLMPTARADDEKGEISAKGKWEYNPKRAGMNSTITAMIQSGRTADEIREWADSVDPGLGARLQGVDAGIAYWKDTKNKRKGQGIPPEVDVEREYIKQDDPAAETMGAALNNPVGAFAAGSVDAYSSGFADEALPGTQAGNEAVFRGMSEEHPLAFGLGNAVGSLAQYATLGPLGGRYLSPGARELFQNTTYGAGSSQPGDRLSGGVTGATTGFLGDKVIKGVTKGAGTMMKGPENAEAQLLIDRKVPTTFGQTVGGGAKSWEDKAVNWPVLGPAITQRRQEAYTGFNQAAFDEALSFIGGKVDEVGEAGVAKAQQQLTDAYKTVLGGTTLTRDPAFDAAIAAQIPGLRGIRRVGDEVADEVDNLIAQSFDPATGTISGEAFQASLAELRQLKRSYRNDPLYGSRIGPELTKVENELTSLFERQLPDKAADFANTNKAYRHVSIIEDAVDNSPAGTGGVFTPAQLRNKSRSNTKLYSGKRASARGDRPFYELDSAGRKNLPNAYPDSGTATRMLPALGVGALATGAGSVATSDEGMGLDLTLPTAGLAGLTLLAKGPYSKGGQKLINRVVSGSRSPEAQWLGSATNKYLAPGLATAFRPFTAGALIDRTPNPDTPYNPGPVPAGAPPVADVPTGPALPAGATLDEVTGEIVLSDGTRVPLEEEPKAFRYGGAVRRLSNRYGCGGRVRRG